MIRIDCRRFSVNFNFTEVELRQQRDASFEDYSPNGFAEFVK